MGIAIDPSCRQDHARMVAFTDSQSRTVWAAADRVPFEKRGARRPGRSKSCKPLSWRNLIRIKQLSFAMRFHLHVWRLAIWQV
jgi:hypothetical protein